MVQFTTIVNAPLEKVWEQLLFKIDNPQNFVPGVSNVQIIEKKDAFVIRQMTVTTAENTTILKEEITFIPYKVRFLLLEHPTMEGYVDNDIKYISESETEMTFSINWKNKITQTEINDTELVKNAVLKTKEYIEKTHETTA